MPVTPHAHTALDTPFTRLAACRYPIVQTAMGWVATPELVAATGNAGGIGFLAAATLSAEDADVAITTTKGLTSAPFGVNFLMEQPGADRIVDSIIEHGVGIASYSRSPRPDVIARLKSSGVRCVPTVGALRHAQKAVELGADAVIVQGMEGGGHTGSVPTTLLLPQVVDAVDVPVVAAGGFHDGRGLVAALALGAAGIAMGTRFLLTSDSPIPRATKERYLAAQVDETTVTRRIDGLPQRVIRNAFLDELEGRSRIASLLYGVRNAGRFSRESGTSLLALMRSGAVLRRDGRTLAQLALAANAPMLVRTGIIDGRPEQGVLPSGQVVGLIDDFPSCAELIDRIVAEASATLTGLDAGGT